MNLLPNFATTTSGGTCTVNGQVVDPSNCAQLTRDVNITLMVMFLLLLVLMVFWVMSLIHVIKHHDVPNRTLWIVLHFVLLGPLAGIIYLLAVKSPYEKKKKMAAASAGQSNVNPTAPPTAPAQTAPGQPSQPVPPQEPQA